MTDAPVQLVWSRDRAFKSIAFEDLAPRPSGYLVKGILPTRGTAFIVGASQAGKSFVALDWFLKLAAGSTVMGKPAKQVGVVYVGAEDPEGLTLRIHAWKVKNPRGSYTPFRLIPRSLNLLDADDVAGLVAELGDAAAIFEAEGFRLGVICFDTLSRCIPGAEENSSQSMSSVVEALDQVGRHFDALAVALAHHGKDGAKGIRGWSGLNAASDATITVERDEAQPDARTITLSKVKNGQDGAVFAFHLDRQPTGIFDEDTEELWSCVVGYDGLADAKVKKARRIALSAHAEMVLSAYGRLVDGNHWQSPPVDAPGVREGAKAVRRPDLSMEAATSGLQYGPDEKPEAYRQRFGRAVTELVRAKRLRVQGDAIWNV